MDGYINLMVTISPNQKNTQKMKKMKLKQNPKENQQIQRKEIKSKGTEKNHQKKLTKWQ